MKTITIPERVTLDVSGRELVILSVLVMTGASAFDTPMADVIKRRTAQRFGVEIEASDVFDVVGKVMTRLVGSGGVDDETVVID